MKKLSFLLLISLPIISVAQTEVPISIFMKDANGRLLNDFSNSYKQEGSPFLLKEFCNANIVSTRGKSYSNIPANINLETSELIFKSPENQMLAVNIPVSRVTFYDCETGGKRVFMSGFSPVDRLTERSFYQLLDSGSVLLLKSYQSNYAESKGYSESIPTRVYEQTTAYYAFLPSKGLIKMPRSISDIPALLESDKKEKLNSFIRSNQLKPRNEADMIKLFSYYNSL